MNLCPQLHQLCTTLPVHRFPFVESSIPVNGLYVLFEEGEVAHDSRRIVRIGGHTGRDNLRHRLIEHFLTENKDRSIFRKHVGRSLLARINDPFLEQWDWDLTSREKRDKYLPLLNTKRQTEVEKEVTDYIQTTFSFVTFRVADDKVRKELEKQLIGTVSSCPDCRPTQEWLGRHHPNSRIRSSGLWNIQGLYKRPIDEAGLTQLEAST
jgi:hypothetical protein